ncbi:type I polyketide synthase [Opitutus terrae]|uniref:Beta-ketoacyl synthase n=1 Tax=Opitutus terrae (strain DSM 11246 / JCM 15787 / PB90-1) TaxID=452637 RepID=B1ZYL0_OPITP|nr:type I polyketide synthase [Opitutus terrae]ACB75246.1 Beta-ketoacyl synthase [Opitutus terrae PB90-1]
MSAPVPEPAKFNPQRLLRALDEAAEKLVAVERARTEPIAIIGLGCRLPGGVRDAAGFWELLRAGVDATSEVPADRWDADALYDPNSDAPGKICTRRGAFLDEVDRFDAAYFGVSPREAAAMDPQQRLLLEVAHEALDSAGGLGDRFEQNATGVFVGITNNDYGQLLKAHAGDRPLDAYFITGNAPNAAAGRISYLLGLRGPSLSVDSACSSSLVTVHLACQSLRSGECALALAGGVNLILAPDASAALSRARMLAPDGRCKTFDAAADGYARGEGCGMVVLKRLGDAQRDGDCILAVIRGSTVNQDGPSSGFTVPSGAAQRQLLRAALAAARLTPAEIDYVEAHGTGTALGDPIEVGALADVYGPQRPADRPLLLGSVKTNIGHLESAAGIAGLMKVVLSLWHRQLPGHLHFREPSPRIPWSKVPVSVVRSLRDWADPGRPRRAGVSSFGVSGTNAHLILEEAPVAATPRALPLPKRRFHGERHWALPPVGTRTSADWLYSIDWREQPRRERSATTAQFAPPEQLGAKLRDWLAGTALGERDAAYAGCLAALERIAAGFARDAVAELGGHGEGMLPGYARLFARLQQLAEKPDAAANPSAAIDALVSQVPAARTEATLLARCGARLPEVLRGQVDPLTLLFPANEPITVATLYGATPTAQAINALVGSTIRSLVTGDRPLRVLEIGAGTGGTTAAILPALPGANVEYVFTDVSPVFVAQARARYGDRPWIRAEQLDIERDPLTQGFAAGEFDLVVAANVLHATRDVAASLQNVRRLLARDGVLLLLEVTAPLALLDLIFGLTEGWWRFADAPLRREHPLLSRERWAEVLGTTGFASPEAFAFPAAQGEIFAQQSVIVARASGAAPAAAADAGRWLIVGEPGLPRFDALAASLERAGAVCERVAPSADVAARWSARTDWCGAIHAAALDATDPLQPEPLASALRLAQALAAQPARLFFVTADAIGTSADDAVGGLAGAALWGFARTVAQEHPELQPTCLDLDEQTDLDAIAMEILRPEPETQIAWRRGWRRVARLVHAPTAGSGTAKRAAISPDATYLIVGGLGGLGVPLARWLVDRGARHLVLASRSAGGEQASGVIAEFATRGATLRCEPMDVSSESDVARVLARIAATPWPLRGVVHAAGVLDDGVLRQLTWSRFQRVLAPKLAGAWQLHRLTAELPIDWTAYFSSATATVGAPGQANHAAANAFLDALAQHRTARGALTLSIAWGPWSEIGAAAERSVGARVKAKGFGTIAPAKGWRVLESLFDAMPTQVAVMPVTWADVPAAFTAMPFFADVRSVGSAEPSLATGAAEEWGQLAPTLRAQRLLAEVRTQVAGVLGLDHAERVDPAVGFFALGMDSLTSVELRNRLQTRLGRALPSTLAFDHPTAEKLAAFLGSLWDPASPERATRTGTDLPVAQSPGAATAGHEASPPLAVIGYALRFPGADTPEKLWELLRQGVDAISEVPRERWDIDAFYDPDPAAPGKMVTRCGGFVSGAEQFDAGFFGISPREAEHMDPQQRLLLETAWEALERAGVAADALAGTPTGVFVGIGSQDYSQLLVARGLDTLDPYVGSGNAHSVAAGRLAYTLGLQGPAVAIDTACSSSLVAIHLAAQSLRTGECEVALAGGVNLLLSPFITVNHSRARMLAPDGRCKAFDASADGFVRSEGCGIVVLKRLDAAQRDSDRILAVLRGSAVNQDGRTSGLTVPSGPAQQAVIRAALRQAGVTPAEVGYVEAHGTGTSLGDPIELGALQAVFGEGRPRGAPLRVGSIKTNLGHLESAAGVAGLIKAVLVLQHREIPPHLHFKNPTPHVPWSECALEVPTQPTPWPVAAGAGPRIVGVSSFGFGGTNAHLVLSEPPEQTAGASNTSGLDGVPLLLSARSEPALQALAQRYETFLRGTGETWPVICCTAAIARSAFRHRLAVTADRADKAAERIAAYLRGAATPDVFSGTVGEPPKVAFLFSGQGSLYAGAGRELFAHEPVYRAALEECRAIVQARAGWDVVAALESEEKLSHTEFGQVALFALQYALARTWQAWGVQPAVVLGHSVGEYAAACVAGVFTTEAALALLIERARLMGELPEDGAMLAVTGTEADVEEILARGDVELGAVNSPRQVVLTGERRRIEAARAELKARGVRAQLLAVRQGYHSRQMEPTLPAFRRAAAATAFRSERTCEFVSGVTGDVAGAELGTADYWVKQIRQPVRFGAAAAAAERAGAQVVIEVGPRGLLIALAQQTWTAGATEWLTSLRPGRGESAQLRASAGQAWVRGVPVRWREVIGRRTLGRAELPTYPFQRRRYWFEEGPTDTAAVVPAPAYVVGWEPQPAPPRGVHADGAWCIVGDNLELAAELRRFGEPVTDDPASAQRGVVWCAAGEESDGPQLQAVLRAVRAPARLWVVTRGAVAVDEVDGKNVRSAAAVAWSAAKIAALEYPELRVTRIDLGADVSMTTLAVELRADHADDDVALRTAGRFGARLREHPLPATRFVPRADGTYLITGGLGALGMRIAEWLVERGARHLLLLGRRGPSAAAEATLQRWRVQGVTVTAQAVDVADRDALAAVLSGCTPPLRGVFHAAGVAGEKPLNELTPADWEAGLRGKGQGARALDELTADQTLDVFVLFSSIASVWGSKAQAHYAAANGWLDALAVRRRAQGRPALSVSWGAWAGGGMATAEAASRLEAAGVRLLAPSSALAALERALTGDAPHVVVASVDWPRFRSIYEARGARSLFEALPTMDTTVSAPAAATVAAVVSAVRAAAPDQQLPLLRAYVQQVLAAILKLAPGELPDARQGFADLGVDSLMAVELKNRLARELGVTLPATLAFDYPDVERLARNLLTRLAPDASVTAGPTNDARQITEAQIAAASDAEVEALLLKKLKKL